MSDKIMLIEIGYYHFVCPMDIGQNALEAFLSLQPVSREYIEGGEIWQPEKERDISVKYIPASSVRSATPEEKEKKEIADLKQRLKWREDEVKKEQKEKKALECELELLKKQNTEEGSGATDDKEG
uniref:Uncharacterized protein n=1 Tax=viral metagenome TaxID=1070528 RepID=A0A6H2A5H3_9ZZZZ